MSPTDGLPPDRVDEPAPVVRRDASECAGRRVHFHGEEGPWRSALARYMRVHGLELSPLPMTHARSATPVVFSAIGKDAFADAFLSVRGKSTGRMVVLTAFPNEIREGLWDSSPLTGAALREVCNLVDSQNPRTMWPAIQAAVREEVPAGWAVDRSTRVVSAWHVFQDLLGPFTHGARGDLTNTLLAPVCILAGSASNSPDGVTSQGNAEFKRFSEQVISRLESDLPKYGVFGDEIVAAYCETATELAHTTRNPGRLREALQRLMHLLTECREMGGRRLRPAGGGWEPRVAALPDRGGDYCVLVIDDHVDFWRPVFEAVAEILRRRGSTVEFAYSSDGQTIQGGGRRVDPGSYDLVILDVFLSGASGLDVLRKIRDHFMWLPVVLWTTSLDVGLAASASLANGFLLKKETALDEIATCVADWAPAGNARRRYAVLNAFFDQHVHRPELRHLVEKVTEAALKVMDSFHALNEDYFLFYNDHGGRHLTRLLRVLEHFLTGMALEEQVAVLLAVPAGGSEAEQNRLRQQAEEEMAGLVIGVLCHELGMYPMRLPDEADGGASEFDAFRWYSHRQCEAVRKLHAVRGMVLLAEDAYCPAELQASLDQLKECDPAGRIRAVAALVVGYHARCLDLSESGFGRLTEDVAKTKIEMHDAELPFRIEDDVRAVLERLGARLREWDRESPGTEKRVRRLCALLRFADGVDIDCSRTPAGFILEHFDRPAENDLEALKRQVVREVRTARGEVHLVFGAPPPDPQVLTEVLDTGASPRLRPFACVADDLDAVRNQSKEIDDYLKALFARGWRAGLSGRPDETKAAQEMASLAALSVVGDVAEEYEAIRVDPELSRYVRLVESHYCHEDEFRMELFTVFRKPPPDPSEGWGSSVSSFRFQLPCPDMAGGVFRAVCMAGRLAIGGWPGVPRGYRAWRLWRTLLADAFVDTLTRRLVVDLKSERQGQGDEVCAQVRLDEVHRPMREGACPPEAWQVEVVAPRRDVALDLVRCLTDTFRLIPLPPALSPNVTATPPVEHSPVLWMDVDTGVDDALALLLAAGSPELCVLAGISAVAGNTSVAQAALNTEKILFAARFGCGGRPLPHVALVPPDEQTTALGKPASDVHGEQGMGNIDAFLSGFVPASRRTDLAGAFRAAVNAHPGAMTFVATGPLSNLSYLVEREPGAVKQLAHVVIMGGAFEESGNVTPCAEFNLNFDPPASGRVLQFLQQNEVQHTFAPLDVTHRVVLKRDDLDAVTRTHPQAGRFLQQLTSEYMEFYDQEDGLAGCPLHDPLALGYALWPELFVRTEHKVHVNDAPGTPFSGQTVWDRRRNPETGKTGVLVGVHAGEFLRRFMEAVLRALSRSGA
jgi:purine nucleosidase